MLIVFISNRLKVELEQTNTSKAIGMMQTFINTHPGSSRIKEATEIIDKCRAKLELKEYKSAELYYNLAALQGSRLLHLLTLLNNYPESTKGDEYKLMSSKILLPFCQIKYC